MSFSSIAPAGAFRALLVETPCLAAVNAREEKVHLGCPLARLSAKLAESKATDPWAHFGVSSEQLLHDVAECVPLTGGNSNAVFLVRAREGCPSFPPLIYREYGIQTSEIVCRRTEVRVSVVLAESGIAPRIEHIFRDGRVERFLTGATTATSSELTDFTRPALLSKVFGALSALHKVEWNLVTGDGNHLPHTTEPHIHRFLRKLTTRVEQLLLHPNSSPHAISFVEEVKREVEWITTVTSERCRGDVVTSHNDLNPGNVLYLSDALHDGKSSSVSDLFLIDFEYSDINFRCFDIANVLCELDLDYSRGACGFVQVLKERRETLKFDEDDNKPILPSLLKAALEGETIRDGHEAAVAAHVLRALQHYHESLNNVSWDDFLAELFLGMLCSHLMWGLWSILMALENRSSAEKLNFGSSGLHYDAYGRCRLLEYASLKKWIEEDIN